MMIVEEHIFSYDLTLKSFLALAMYVGENLQQEFEQQIKGLMDFLKNENGGYNQWRKCITVNVL